MTVVLPNNQPPQGNAIVPNPPQKLSFPALILAGVVVTGGIYIADEIDSRAAWLLAFLILLGIAFSYRSFGDELVSLVSGASTNQQTTQPTKSAMIVSPSGPPIDTLNGYA